MPYVPGSPGRVLDGQGALVQRFEGGQGRGEVLGHGRMDRQGVTQVREADSGLHGHADDLDQLVRVQAKDGGAQELLCVAVDQDP